MESLFLLVFSLAGGALLCWLLIKLIDRIFGEYAILKPFNFIGGVYEDLKDLSEEWRDIRRERREREEWRREEYRKNKEIIEARRREAFAENDAPDGEGEAEENAAGASLQVQGRRP